MVPWGRSTLWHTIGPNIHQPERLSVNVGRTTVRFWGATQFRAEARFTQSGSDVYRLRTSDFVVANLAPAAAAALLIYALYPTIKNTAVALGYNPDAPDTLAKVTVTV